MFYDSYMNSKQVAAGTSESKMPPIDPKYIAGMESPAPSFSSPAATIIDDVKRLQVELATKRNSAIEALLAQRTDIDATLTSLGFADDASPKERNKKRQSKTAAERVCKICSVGGRTVMGHDARAHRSQTKKKPFNTEELAMHA